MVDCGFSQRGARDLPGKIYDRLGRLVHAGPLSALDRSASEGQAGLLPQAEVRQE